MRAIGLAFALAMAVTPSMAQDAAPLSQWVQLEPGGGEEARAVTSAAACPAITINGKASPMSERAAPDANFPGRVCSATIPALAKSAAIAGTALPLMPRNPDRILVFGDTGCRIKGSAIQNCNDPKRWPFPQIAQQAAKLKPDLVIHVGDYLYRESACPDNDPRCAGTPHGDNWASWNADFFAPAAPLLAASPWVIVRGNHEDCERAGAGWQRLLGPVAFDPTKPCIAHIAPYAVPIGIVNLIVLDNATAPDTSIDNDQVPVYRDDFASIPKLAKTPIWLAMHRPIWGAVTGPLGLRVGGNRTMIAALPPHALDKVSLMLAGHIHTFEVLNYGGHTPAQIVAGFGGDALDPTPLDLT
ncbi:MAG TPA: metallophosphoesterase, partial [Rhizomicrobium sp.]|nr:metallophosphoesterase [Rhizomicrobium sp.]